MSLVNEAQIKVIFELDHTGGLFRNLLNIYEEDMPLHISNLEKALSASDFETAKKISHSIKSSSLNMGAMDLAKIAGELEYSLDMKKSYDDGVTIEMRKCFQYTLTELKVKLDLCKT